MDSGDSLDRTPDSIDLTESPEKNTKTQKHIEKTNEDTSDNDTDEMITYETDELKKSNRKNVNKAKKKGRTTKIYTMNIERKRLLKQERERTLQNAKGKGPAEEYFLTALKASHKSYKASKNSHKKKKDNNGLINDENTNITRTVYDINNLEIVENHEVNNPNKNQKIHHHKHKMTNTIMRILTTITIMRIIEVNPEAIDPIEAKIQDVPLEAKISMAEVKETRAHIKANIKLMAIKAIITRVTEDFIITHIEISLKVIAAYNLEAEAVAEAEAITAVVVMVGPIMEAMLSINIISIMVMMMSTRQTNIVHHALYAVATTTLPNIILKGSMTSMILWKR